MNEIEKMLEKQLEQLSDSFQLNDLQLQQLNLFYCNLIEWNKVMNLTTITEQKDVYEKHFLDSLSILALFTSEDFAGKNIIDVGTGAGFPGLVLAIAFPDAKVVLIDALNKRISFLNDTIQKLSLHNVETIHCRAEELARNKEHREKYDYAVSRAVANLSTLCEYDLPFVKIKGSFIAYKSGKVEEETANAAKAIQILGGNIRQMKRFILPYTEYERCLVRIVKVKFTPNKYPRKAGMPGKEPIV